jgi:hypothetical protein
VLLLQMVITERLMMMSILWVALDFLNSTHRKRQLVERFLVFLNEMGLQSNYLVSKFFDYRGFDVTTNVDYLDQRKVPFLEDN